MSENPLFSSIKSKVDSDPIVAEYAVPGACRIWTDLAMKVVRENYEPAQVACEAREVVILDSLTHSFLRVEVDGEVQIWDGVGVNFNLPFFGSEEDAPEHLKNSTPDGLLNTYST